MHEPTSVTVLAEILVLLVFANRYLFGALITKLRGRSVDPRRDDFEPTITAVIPMFNEGRGAERTVRSLLEQDYPAHKLDVVVVDDCSTDESYACAARVARDNDRVTVLRNAENLGKRKSINRAVRGARGEIIVSVDSDVELDPGAVRALVARFVRPEIAAVGGRVNVVNRNENWLTRMQAIKYFFGYEYLKNTERAFHTVMCLSGCLTAYRKDVLLALEPVLENRNVLGIPIKYGEDRFLTRQIVKAGYQTTLTLDAVCYTRVPTTLGEYFSQQLRWRRSNLIDYLGGLAHVWKTHPIVSIHYFSLFALLVTYPLLVISSLLQGTFFHSNLLHLAVLSVFGLVYWLHARGLPADERVSPFAFLGMAVVMPVTYVLLTPLALFTLDSGSWETRRKPLAQETPEPAVPFVVQTEPSVRFERESVVPG